MAGQENIATVHEPKPIQTAGTLWGQGRRAMEGPHGPQTHVHEGACATLDGPYEVMPQYKARGTQEKIDITAVFVVELRQHPVLIIEIKSPANLPHASKREEADNQMRQRLQSLGRQLTIPVLHGISAFGTCLCFYTYHTRSQEVTPAGIPAHPTLVSDVARQMSLQSIAGIVTSCKLMEWNA